jgi:hypothetical protein
MGTMIRARDLSAQDFGGPALGGCNEHLNLTRPDVILTGLGYSESEQRDLRDRGIIQ